jgi:hypothetical protein
MKGSYVDESAFTSLSNANKEAMAGEDAAYASGISAGQNSRQPEIDALKAEVARLKAAIRSLTDDTN